MEIDLERLADETYSSGMKNLEASNEFTLEKIRQCFGLATFNLVFIASVFAFLKDYLSSKIFFFSLYYFLGGSTVINMVSIFLGVFGLRLNEVHLRKVAKYNFDLFEKIRFFIYKNGTRVSGSLPEELKYDYKILNPGNNLALCLKYQFRLMWIGLAVTAISIFGLLIVLKH